MSADEESELHHKSVEQKPKTSGDLIIWCVVASFLHTEEPRVAAEPQFSS